MHLRTLSVMLAVGLAAFLAPAVPAQAHSTSAKTSTLCQQVRAWSGEGCTPQNTRAFWKAQAKKREATRASRSRRASTSSAGVWDRLAQCESGGNWSINTGNGYYGGVQFSLSSWRATGGKGYPHQNSKSEQIRRAEILQDMQGWGAWPACSRKLGLR